MRAFVGLPLPEPWIAPLVRAQGVLSGGRAVPVDDLHLTLAFLDDQSEPQLEALHDALDLAIFRPVTLHPVAWSSFGGKRARRVALDVRPTSELADLRDRVRRAARAAGIDLSRDRFRPHVTLLRYPASAPADPARLTRALSGLGRADLPGVAATQVTLWASQLTPEGPIYDVLSSYPIRAMA
ncbi:RNA 2',3'-cyclic phosphodiesterase [Jannaschia sp. M317]|uniref:RNA 2',3'-cyclic phosphodiesterase n=1 Tax=Jannaschia sp. M317 TaxID=2867011 RepID=UPI0021A2E10B|nr:RNA 2',3'-cyclic phosphodiesterase [Jannaschia sp. M317]UWQ17707.1 RNA 2',3'-cyclic phosphodiesterase [Jannaschia sp. M317]